MKFEYESVECREGWSGLYKPLIDLCNLYGIQVMQVKEKFGGLRFYVMGERSAELWDIIRAAESESYHTCEDCGTSKITGWATEGKPIYLVTTTGSETSGWIRSLCPPCREKWDASRREGGRVIAPLPVVEG